MTIRILFDEKKCSACGACSVACMDQNDIDIEGGQRPYRRVYEEESDQTIRCISSACRHCTDAPCADICPKHCLYREAETGLTLYDNEDCIGCGLCAKSCPFDAVTFRPTGQPRPKRIMEKCNGCRERVLAGLQPACVRACPTGALLLKTDP